MPSVPAMPPLPPDPPGLKADIHVNIAEDGAIVVQRRKYSARALRALLHEVAARHLDADGLANIVVRINAHPECEFRYVAEAMAQCGAENIYKLQFRLGAEEEVIVNHLPIDAGIRRTPAQKGADLRRATASIGLKLDETSGELVMTGGRGAVRDARHLEKSLRQLAEKYDELSVVIDAGADVPFSHVFNAMRAARNAGAKDVQFRATPPGG